MVVLHIDPLTGLSHMKKTFESGFIEGTCRLQTAMWRKEGSADFRFLADPKQSNFPMARFHRH
jgi:hypothetical protein